MLQQLKINNRTKNKNLLNSFSAFSVISDERFQYAIGYQKNIPETSYKYVPKVAGENPAVNIREFKGEGGNV